jgi:hypothetical protein
MRILDLLQLVPMRQHMHLARHSNMIIIRDGKMSIPCYRHTNRSTHPMHAAPILSRSLWILYDPALVREATRIPHLTATFQVRA